MRSLGEEQRIILQNTLKPQAASVTYENWMCVILSVLLTAFIVLICNQVLYIRKSMSAADINIKAYEATAQNSQKILDKTQNTVVECVKQQTSSLVVSSGK